MSEQKKPNYLAAGITNALPQRGTPPPPPVVKRPRERNVEEEQVSENANVQESKSAQPSTGTQVVGSQEREPEATPASMMTEEQVRAVLTQMLSSTNTPTQSENKAKRQKVDLAALLIQTIAICEGSESIKEQFSKLANLQKTKINQGLFAPEALFTIYNSASIQMKLAGKKVTMSDLMAKALIAYVPEIIKELEQEQKL